MFDSAGNINTTEVNACIANSKEICSSACPNTKDFFNCYSMMQKIEP